MTDREKQRLRKRQLPESMLKLVKTDNYITPSLYGGIGEMSMSYTDNPVRDAEEYCSREDLRPIVGACEYCGNPIYGPTEDMYGDDYVELPDGLVHWECWNDYGRSLRKEAV